MKSGLSLLLILAATVHPAYAQDTASLSLEAAVLMALDENTDLSIAKRQIESSKYALKEATGNFLPKLQASANYFRNIDRQVIFLPDIFGMGGATKLGSDNDYRASLNLSLPIFSNYNFTNKSFAQTRLAYQNEAARHTKQKVINATKKAYFNCLIAQEIVDVRQTQLKNAEDILVDIEKRMRQGTLTDYDLTVAKVQVSQAKSGLLEAQNNIMPLSNALKLLLGLSPNAALKLTEPITQIEEELAVEGNAAEMLEHNSVLKQLEMEIDLNEKQVEMAKSAYYPTIEAIGTYNIQAQEDGFDLSDYRWVNSSLVGVQLQFSIFNGNITKNKIQQAQIAKHIAQEQKDHATRANQMQLQELLSQLDFASQKTAVQRESMNLTEEAFNLAKKRYQYGVGTILEVNDAELSYTQARLIWLQAISDYKMAYYDYQLLMGRD